eukprot:m.32501 g.32501  ORF g.32501 m.32501 type:complete len:483 (+) comp5544_c0_seq1:876-2324(+)
MRATVLGALLSVLLASAIVFFSRSAEQPSAVAALQASLDTAASAPPRRALRIAVGLNAAVDIIVDGTDLLAALNISAPANPRNHDLLHNEEELAECFGHYFALGTAAERWFTDPENFRAIADAARHIPGTLYFTGGNAALMALHMVEAFSGDGVEVLLVAPTGPQLRQLLDPRIRIPEALQHANDEVHLILEYQKGEQWGPLTAQRANRFIFSHDITNAEMRPLEVLQPVVETFGADIVVVSGVHMLEGQSAEVRRARLHDLVGQLKLIPRHLPIHLELASIADLGFIAEIAKVVLPHVDSVGLNEQELASLSLATNGPFREILEQEITVPPSALIADLLYWMLTRFSGGESRLSRIHFHSLTFHIIAAANGRWRDAAGAVAAGALTCARRACAANELTDELVELLFPARFALHMGDTADDVELRALANERTLDPTEAIVEWARDSFHFALAPVLVCRRPTKTVGLGDAISAAGLALHTFLP